MFTLYAAYKVIENFALKDEFVENYSRCTPDYISYAIGKLWQPGIRDYYEVKTITNIDVLFDRLGGYQPLIQIHKLALGMALDAVIALGVYYAYNTFKEPTHHLRFTPKESGLQHDNNDTTNQTLTDLSPEIMPMGESPHNNSMDH